MIDLSNLQWPPRAGLSLLLATSPAALSQQSALAAPQQTLGTDQVAVTAAPEKLPAVHSGLKELIYPDQSHHPIVEAINAANKSIDLEMYLLSDQAILKSLGEAARRGVKVRVLLESHPFGGGAEANKKAFTALQEAGAEARWTSRKFVFTHEKGMVIDGNAAWIMTANMSASARVKNREYLVVDSNRDDIDEVQNIFNSDWEQTPYVPGAAFGHLAVSPINARSQILALINQAKSTLSLGFEVIGDQEVQDALIAKAKQGVKVQVLISDPHGQGKVPEVAQQLQDGGCEVKYLDTPYLHAKVIAADNQTIYLGSVNLTTNSMNKNRELGIIIDQPDIVQGTVATFAQDWQAGGPTAAQPQVQPQAPSSP